MMIQALIDQYTQLRNNAELHLGKGHVDYIAHCTIVDALTSPGPKQALLIKIAVAQDAIVRNDQRCWNRREGYRGYYQREIALFEQALRDLDGAKEVCDATTV